MLAYTEGIQTKCSKHENICLQIRMAEFIHSKLGLMHYINLVPGSLRQLLWDLLYHYVFDLLADLISQIQSCSFNPYASQII